MRIDEYLFLHAKNTPEKSAFIFLQDGEDAAESISFLELKNRVLRLAEFLQHSHFAGRRALLLYSDSMDFVYAFLSCKAVNIIAVPHHFSKGARRQENLRIIAQDVQPEVILTTDAIYKSVDFSLFDREVMVCITDNTPKVNATSFGKRHEEIAFLQYTSGSTTSPKGVIITHGNLMSNQVALQETFGCDENSVIFSWLPFHHDMGLIGNILHAIYVGCTCILMSPYHFLQKPSRWLKGITKYKVTHSGGPNFAFEYCTNRISDDDVNELNLSSWQVAYCGSEPVRCDTLSRFAARFESVGFKRENLYPCYGLAEGTLLVSGRKGIREPLLLRIPASVIADGKIRLLPADNPAGKSVVSCGSVPAGTQVAIISHEGRRLNELEEGQICVAGPSVSQGYWGRDNTDLFYRIDDTLFLKTGDLGFVYKDELFIHGRIKEMLVVRGKNYYPNDVEAIVADCDKSIMESGVAVFAYGPALEEIIVVAEIARADIGKINASKVVSKISQVVAGAVGQEPSDILLVPPFNIPRTTSGKLRRIQSRTMYGQHSFKAIATKTSVPVVDTNNAAVEELVNQVLTNRDYVSVRNYVINAIENKVGGTHIREMDDDVELTHLGLDSLRAMEVLNTINRHFSLNLHAAGTSQGYTLHELISTVENMIWLKYSKPSDQNIIL